MHTMSSGLSESETDVMASSTESLVSSKLHPPTFADVVNGQPQSLSTSQPLAIVHFPAQYLKIPSRYPDMYSADVFTRMLT